ncbi:MAG: GIY-YIG nuclease family protein [Trueperaceae bacterium]
MPGVYEIADRDKRTVYVGQSSRDVPTRVRQHLSAGGCVAERASYWRTAYSRVPQATEAELLARHRERHGDLPVCNRATPRDRDPVRRWRERSRG